MQNSKKNVVISILGVAKDAKGQSKGEKRWDFWRPTVSLAMHDDFKVDRLELLHHPNHFKLAHSVADDIRQVSPHTDVVLVETLIDDPWDYALVYQWFHEFARHYPVNIDDESYHFNITTGTHVHQICMFLMSEAHLLPAKIIQASPDHTGRNRAKGLLRIIDLDLDKYDVLAQRFIEESLTGQTFLKAGIQTRNPTFNRMIEQIEKVALRSSDPVLLSGPTGAGKSQLARRIYELKSAQNKLTGSFVPVNCATLRGEGAMSALFGHSKGAFTGAAQAREGYLRQADQGILFLDEIGELGLDEQAMLLHAIEEKQFYPLGSDKVVSSDFQLLAGTNKDLQQAVANGAFREDLLARIDIWHWQLPALKDRLEDLEANIDFELRQQARLHNKQVRFNKSARDRYLSFAQSAEATWSSNFRDLNASITRMVTLSESGRIDENNVQEEIERLRQRWQGSTQEKTGIRLEQYISSEKLATIDQFDQAQLQHVIGVLKESKSMADAGRKLFDVSRLGKKSVNDSHRVRVFLKRFGIEPLDV